jgi:predicted nucleotidyltransferase
MLTDALDDFVESLKQVLGVVAIVAGGSKVRGTADTFSDTDLGLYYDRRNPLNVGVLDAVAAECDDRKAEWSGHSVWRVGSMDRWRRLAANRWASS